jgi:hypothetical protein
MWIIVGIITGIAAVLVGLLFRHAGLVLFALLAWWVHGWLTTDRIREHHQIELRNEEYAAVQGQRLKVLAKNVEVIFEKYGDHEVRATIENGSVARISDIQLKCSYERPYEDEPWKLTTPVASTSFINPGESRRISFWLRDAASDAIPSSFACNPIVTLNEVDLLHANVVQPKNSGDRLLAQTNISIAARVGDRTKIDRREVIAEGSISNYSKTTVTAINLTCSGMINELGQTRSIRGYTNVYVRPGQTTCFAFQVGLMQEETPAWGIKNLACRVSSLQGS